MRQRENPGTTVLLNALPSALHPQVRGADVWITSIGRGLRFRPIWAGEGLPADIRNALRELATTSDDPIPVITARRMGPGARALLREHSLAWADGAGFAEITDQESVYVIREKPNALPRRALDAMSWSRSAIEIVEFLLSRRAQHPGLNVGAGLDPVTHIGEAVGVSPAQVSKVLVALDEAGYTAKFGPDRGPGSGRTLENAGALLSDWAAAYGSRTRERAHVEFHVPSRNPEEWLRVAADSLQNYPWAVSGWVAADAIAPHVTAIPDLTLCVREDIFDDAARALREYPEVTEVVRGARMRLYAAEPYCFGFVHRVNGTPLASPVRVFADLLRSGNRGSDAAEHLRETVIGF